MLDYHTVMNIYMKNTQIFVKCIHKKLSIKMCIQHLNSCKALQRQQRAAKQVAHEMTETADNEVSRTPEDSVCSVEGPSVYNDGPSTYSELGGFGTPNVQHRNRQ